MDVKFGKTDSSEILSGRLYSDNDPEVSFTSSFKHLTPRLSEFEILNNANLIFQNRPISRLFTNLFYNLDFAEEH